MNVALKLQGEDVQEDQAAFLGVTRSVKEQVWRERLNPQQTRLATAICQQQDLPDLLGRILAARGATLENVATLMAPTLPRPSNATPISRSPLPPITAPAGTSSAR
jgi:single-stranded-DNA-specific exonuclease